jgi:hypothetical protein
VTALALHVALPPFRRERLLASPLAFYEIGGRMKMEREGRCRMCLTPRQRRGSRMLSRHHLVPKAWEGWKLFGHLRYRIRDADANVIPLCLRCHREVETDEWARRMLRKVLGQEEIAFAIQVRGKAWLDARYSPPPQDALDRRAA